MLRTNGTLLNRETGKARRIGPPTQIGAEDGGNRMDALFIRNPKTDQPQQIVMTAKNT